MVREPLLLPFAALAMGILGAHFFFFNLPDLAVPALLCTLVLTLAFTIQSARRMRLAIICTVLALGGVATEITHRQGRAPRLNAEDTETVLLTGCVTNPPVFSPDRGQFTLELAPKAAARISVVLKGGQKLPLSYGQKVEVAAKIRSPRNFGNPESFDYVAYLAAQHIYWTDSVSSPSDIRPLPGRCGSAPVAWLFAIRTWALERLMDLYPDDHQTGALLQATLIGETSGGGTALDERFPRDRHLPCAGYLRSAHLGAGVHDPCSYCASSACGVFRPCASRRLPAGCMRSYRDSALRLCAPPGASRCF